MRTKILCVSLLLLAGSALPAAAAESPVPAQELNHFIGATLYGHAYAPLGIVMAADKQDGIIAIRGPEGTVATVGDSMLVSDGLENLRAPLLNVGDIIEASNLRYFDKPFEQPRIIVGKPGENTVPFFDQDGRRLYDEHGNRIHYGS